MIPIEEIRDRVMDILASVSGIPREEINADTTFGELELDSLSRIELLVDLERDFDIESPEDEEDEDLLEQIQSVEDAARLVEGNLATQEAA